MQISALLTHQLCGRSQVTQPLSTCFLICGLERLIPTSEVTVRSPDGGHSSEEYYMVHSSGQEV